MLPRLYVIWAGLFIYQSSYVAIDGQRYYALFDDAMISMRYAWNFAHGLGLVWNAGQRVEGYSNLLMTLGMSLAAFILDKKLAVLAVQVAGIPTVIITALLARRLSNEISGGQRYQALAGVLVLACVLFYYPLSYWTLMGMETGVLCSAMRGLRMVWPGLDKERPDARSAGDVSVRSTGLPDAERFPRPVCRRVCVFGHCDLSTRQSAAAEPALCQPLS